jgi:iron complex outermembrane receptor protein
MNTSRTMRHRGLAPLFGLCAALASGPATAEDPSAAGLDEVIVTAQKVQESLQSVPISIAAVGAELIDRSSIVNLDALQMLTPGITIAVSGAGFTSYTYVRGAGTNVVTPDAEPSVAFFVDEVYQAGTAGLMSDFLDIARVEVLKGPQGTLFGRNAAAGAVSIVTKRAEETFNAWASGEAGNFGAWNVKGGVTGPMSADGRWRYRVAASTRERDAFTQNMTGKLDPGFVDHQAFRGSLEYVGDRFTARLGGDYFRADDGMTNSVASTAYRFCTDFMNAAACAATPAATLPPVADLYHTYYDVEGYERQKAWSTTLRLEWTIGDATLTSISALRDNRFERLADYDATANNAFALASDEHDRTFSQELRAAGAGARTRWIAGLYYFDTDTERLDNVRLGPAFPVPAFAALPGLYHQDLTVKSRAAFGQFTYDFTEALAATIGGRYSRDEKSSTVTNDPFGPATTFRLSQRPTWSSFDPSLSLQYQFTPAAMLYGSVRKGFKSGGFQSLAGSAAIASRIYAPEKVRSYELGLKSRWWDDKLQLNVAAFRTEIDDQQIQRVPSPGTSITDNAGKTNTNGADVEISVLPVAHLRLDANATFQRARFARYESLVGTTLVSFAGNHQLRSPDQTFALAAEYSVPLRNAGTVSTRVDYFHQSVVFYTADNLSFAGANQGGYGLVNARIGYVSANGTWDVSVYGRNLADEAYYRNVSLSARWGLATPGDPRTYGVTFGWRYR